MSCFEYKPALSSPKTLSSRTPAAAQTRHPASTFSRTGGWQLAPHIIHCIPAPRAALTATSGTGRGERHTSRSCQGHTTHRLEAMWLAWPPNSPQPHMKAVRPSARTPNASADHTCKIKHHREHSYRLRDRSSSSKRGTRILSPFLALAQHP